MTAPSEEQVQQYDIATIMGNLYGDGFMSLKGAFNRSSVGTLVERKTRFVVLCKMDGNTAEAALEARGIRCAARGGNVRLQFTSGIRKRRSPRLWRRYKE